MIPQDKSSMYSVLIESVIGLTVHDLIGPAGIGITGASLLYDQANEILGKAQNGTLGKQELETALSEMKQTSQTIVQNLEGLANNLLASRSRLLQYTSTDIRLINPKEAWKTALTILDPRSSYPKITIHQKFHLNHQINCRSGILEVIFYELLKNSLKHGFQPNQIGEIEMKELLNSKDSSYCLIYSDTGRGISEEKQTTLNKPTFGNGIIESESNLGFSIIYRLVSRYLHGSIQVAPNNPGTLVTLTIPTN